MNLSDSQVMSYLIGVVLLYFSLNHFYRVCHPDLQLLTFPAHPLHSEYNITTHTVPPNMVLHTVAPKYSDKHYSL